MTWKIKPFVGVGTLVFGQQRDSVRDILGEKYHSFKKTVDENETDAYAALGLHLYYDNDNCLQYIEAFQPADIEFSGISLLARPIAKVFIELQECGCDGAEDDIGVVYASLGFGLVVSDGVVDGVGVFRKGYYD